MRLSKTKSKKSNKFFKKILFFTQKRHKRNTSLALNIAGFDKLLAAIKG